MSAPGDEEIVWSLDWESLPADELSPPVALDVQTSTPIQPAIPPPAQLSIQVTQSSSHAKRKNKDWNVCEHCNLYLPLDAAICPNCEQPILLDAKGKISLWRLGDLPDGIIGNLAAGLRVAFGVSAVIQPTFLDERPSQRPAWRGLSAGVFLDQVERRHLVSVFVNLGITERNIVPDSRHNFLFGYAYQGKPAAVVSLHALSKDDPSEKLLVTRVLNIAIHEIGHTLGLDHHGYNDNVECVMIGDDEIDSIEGVDECSSTFCADCQRGVARLRSGAAQFGVNVR